jgi:hypothetical protein
MPIRLAEKQSPEKAKALALTARAFVLALTCVYTARSDKLPPNPDTSCQALWALIEADGYLSPKFAYRKGKSL